MLYVAGVHGINLTVLEQTLYPGKWCTWFKSRGIRSIVLPAGWRSTGYITGDLAKFSSKKFREEQVALVAKKITYLYSLYIRDYLHNNYQFVVMAHSMGMAIAASALERLDLPSVPLVAFGGPLGHPASGRLLASFGFELKNRNGVHFYNLDDNVCSTFRFYRQIPNWKHIPVAIPGDGGFVKEHADKFYIRHPVVVDWIKDNLNYE